MIYLEGFEHLFLLEIHDLEEAILTNSEDLVLSYELAMCYLPLVKLLNKLKLCIFFVFHVSEIILLLYFNFFFLLFRLFLFLLNNLLFLFPAAALPLF